jgi:succinate dehydrogenase/fumarate reductase flavoprotein subunit
VRRPLGQAGLRPQGAKRDVAAGDILKAVQDEILPLEKNVFRHGATMTASMTQLDAAWGRASGALAGSGDARSAVQAREAAGMAAASRWIYTAALAREETRGLHRRRDYPDTKPELRRNLLVRGLSDITVTPQPLVAAPVERPALVAAIP